MAALFAGRVPPGTHAALPCTLILIMLEAVPLGGVGEFGMLCFLDFPLGRGILLGTLRRTAAAKQTAQASPETLFAAIQATKPPQQ